MTQWIFLASALALVVAGAAYAQTVETSTAHPAPPPSTALLGNIDFAVDGDGVHVSSVRLGGSHPCGAYLDSLGFAAQKSGASRFGATGDAIGIARGLGWHVVADSGIKAEAGFVQAGGRTRIVGDATWSARPAEKTSVELVAAGDLVATQPAIDRGIAYGFFGVAAEQSLADGITANGLAGYQSFTDGNERTHLRARLVWQAAPEYGLNAQLRWRRYESGHDGFEGAYFNPDAYAQWQGVLDLRRRIGSWTLSGALGAGVETVDGADRHPVRTAELRAEGVVVDKLRLAVYARYNRSTDGADTLDHSYGQAGATLRYPF